MLISSFTLAWRRSISHILCTVRLGIGKQSGFILITMLLLFRKGLLDLRSSVTSGMRMLIMLIRWEIFSSRMLGGKGREWLGLQLSRLGLVGKSSPCSVASTLDSSIRDCMIPLDFCWRRLVEMRLWCSFITFLRGSAPFLSFRIYSV